MQSVEVFEHRGNCYINKMDHYCCCYDNIHMRRIMGAVILTV